MARKKSRKRVVKRKSKKASKLKAIKVDLSKLKSCPECASNTIFYSKMRDELVCRDCGGIFSKLTPEQMAKYKKKPVVIEAVQFNGDIHEPELYALLCKPPIFQIIDEGNYLTIETLEGDMRVDIGDYVIKGVIGELYPCKPDIFEATYEKVV